MHKIDPSMTVHVHTVDDKDIEWNYDAVVKAFPEIVDQKESKFDGYNGKLHIELPLTSLTVNYLAELFLDPTKKEVNFHAIDVCLRDLADHKQWRRVVRELISKSIARLNFKNAISIWKLCRKYEHYKMKHLDRYITYHLSSSISRVSIAFFRLSIDELTHFLSSDYLHVQTEDEVVEMIDLYVKADENNRSHLYPLLYSHVRTRYLRNPTLISYDLPVTGSFRMLLNAPPQPQQDLAPGVPKEGDLSTLLTTNTRQLLEAHGNKAKRERVQRDIFLLFGGTVGGAYQPYPSFFNHDTKSWCELNFLGLPAPFVYHAVVVLEGTIYIFGGGDTQEAYSRKMWKLVKGKWLRCADMNDKRANMANMVVTYDKKIYVMGGNQHFVTRLSSFECYNPETDMWFILPDMPHARADGAACVIGDGIYVSGGLSSNRVLTEVDLYLPKEREWRSSGSLPVGLSGHSMIAQETPSGSYFLIYGGYTGKERITRVYAKKITEKVWIQRANMNTARSSACLMPYGRDNLIIFGGNNGKGAFAEKWNGDVWEIFDASDLEREGSRVVQVPDFYHEIHEV